MRLLRIIGVLSGGLIRLKHETRPFGAPWVDERECLEFQREHEKRQTLYACLPIIP